MKIVTKSVESFDTILFIICATSSSAITDIANHTRVKNSGKTMLKFSELSSFCAPVTAMIANTAAKGITNSAKVIADFIALKKPYVSRGAPKASKKIVSA